MKKIFSTYWAGYLDNSNITLDMVPDYIDIVILAFIGPNSDSSVETRFLCSKYSAEEIKEWINLCHTKKIKVYISLLDTPSVHWDTINIPLYAKNINKFMNEWNIDGIDIDAESGMNPNKYVSTFTYLIESLKKYNHFPITYTCYEGTNSYDGQILDQIKDQIDYIQLMAYFDTYDGMVSLYNDYKKIMGDNIIIGVKAGKPEGTSLDEVSKLCLWNSKKRGMMLWTINRDLPFYTNKSVFTWANTINIELNNVDFIDYKNVILSYLRSFIN
uniref:Glycosyl hydrolase family 18 n=1 Tax=Megaviridae environmental sample TaxID=1737588 RepID=A0A5J6VL03_9VIRU|nr:MAG: glycosyl hydrolase family 18 [Megaviridae environmental sample]